MSRSRVEPIADYAEKILSAAVIVHPHPASADFFEFQSSAMPPRIEGIRPFCPALVCHHDISPFLKISQISRCTNRVWKGKIIDRVVVTPSQIAAVRS